MSKNALCNAHIEKFLITNSVGNLDIKVVLLNSLEGNVRGIF